MTFRESLEITKLDLSKLIVIPSGGSGGFFCEFDITPKDFLRYAKEDLRESGGRNIINGLSNAKRAIDCQIDNVLHNLGLDYHKPNKAVERFLSHIDFKDDISFKLKIISALNLAPGFLIGKTRTVRNKLEHYYKIPSIEEAKESIDIADLFIRSVDGILRLPTNEFYITDEQNYLEKPNEHYENFKTGYFINFDPKIKEIEFNIRIDDRQLPIPKFTISNSNIEFFGFIRLMFSIDDDSELTESFKIISQLINHPIPVKHIKVEQY